jgi:hypothetical protein
LETFRGGIRAGGFNATWPFGLLSIAPRRLVLSITLKLPFALRSYEFTPEQVSSVALYGFIPLFLWGIRVHHTRPDYPQRVIFWCFRNRRSILDQIARCGFACAV